MSGDNPEEGFVPVAVRTLRAVRNSPGELPGASPAESPGESPRQPQGESQAELASLFRTHHRHVFLAAHRVTGSAADAEDVLQTVFLRLAKSGEKYDLSENPQAYLSRAAINASLDLIRSRTRANSVGLDDVTNGLETRTANPERQHADRELQTLIRQAVGRLGATAAEMFVLRYYEGYNNQEIAKCLGTSQMVVGVVLHRARTKLRKEIGHYLEKHHK
jgi:RNA polymerase sigma-70 factor (ECF subfamily)